MKACVMRQLRFRFRFRNFILQCNELYKKFVDDAKFNIGSNKWLLVRECCGCAGYFLGLQYVSRDGIHRVVFRVTS